MECCFSFMYASAWCWILSVAWAFIWQALLLAFSMLVAALSCWYARIDQCFCFIYSDIVAQWIIRVMYSWKKYLDKIEFLLTGGHCNNIFSLAIFIAIHPSRFLEGAIGVGRRITLHWLIFGWCTLEFTAEDVCFVVWKLFMLSANDFFSLSWRAVIYSVMNSSLLVTIREGTVIGWVVVRQIILLEFAAEGKDISNCFFSLAWKIAISLAMNSLHCSIIIVGLVGSGVKDMGGGGIIIFFFVIVFGFIVIVVVFVIVGWFTRGGLPEA